MKYFYFFLPLLFLSLESFPQCFTSGDGQNLISNGDFSSGAAGFTTGYSANCPGASGSTVAGQYCITNDINNFHCCLPDFNGVITHTFSDHTSGADNYAMLIDGSGISNTDIWCQTVSVQPSTNYFFTAHIATLYYDGDASRLGRIRLKINGTPVGTTIVSPANQGEWASYTYMWSSGSVSGSVSICITNDITVSDPGNDFALDDISFTSGCAYGDPGPIPLLNSGVVSVSLCGNPTGVDLNSGVASTTSEFIWQKDGAVTSGNSSVLTATSPGAYTVCVREVSPTMSCWRSDSIVVEDDYSINLGSDLTLCDPPSVTLDAGHTGTGVTYEWTKNGNILNGQVGQNLLVAEPGIFQVLVNDSLCGIRIDEIQISSLLTATPVNALFCPTESYTVDLSVTGSGIFNWYDAPVNGNLLASNTNSYTSPVITNSTTYYVEDAALTDYAIGPDQTDIGGGTNRYNGNYASSPSHYLEFEILRAGIEIKEVTMYAYCESSSCSGTVRVAFYNSSGVLQGESDPVSISITSGFTYLPVIIPVNVTLTSTEVYRASIKDNSNSSVKYLIKDYINFGSCSFSSAFDLPQVFDFRSGQGPTDSHCHWPYFFNWKISAPGACGRVPVQAIAYCQSIDPGLSPDSSSAISMIPNLITPNEDDLNDYFEFVPDNYDGTVQLSVFNRWGEIVFTDRNYRNTWNAGDVSDGIYFFSIESSKDPELKYKGWIHVIK